MCYINSEVAKIENMKQRDVFERINFYSCWSDIHNLTRSLYFGNQEFHNNAIQCNNEYKQKGCTGGDTDLIKESEYLHQNKNTFEFN